MKFLPLLISCVLTQVVHASPGVDDWVPVQEPFVMSIYNIETLYPDTLHITDLGHPTARRNCSGEGAPMVIFLDHGVPGTNFYAPQGAPPSGFKWVYYDHNNDGTPDGANNEQILALDLEGQTDVWVTWGLQNDLTIRYIRPGQRVLVEMQPGIWEYQNVYHPTQRSEASGSGAIGCDRDELSRRGGHNTISATSMSQFWH